MSRIRTVKPELLRHEELQKLEIRNPGASCILVFIGLFSACDKLGHFPWQPRQLKLDIFPFLPFDMEKTLALLREASFVSLYEVDGKQYGEIPSFTKHQRINGKEAYDGPKYPERSKREAPEKQQRSREVEREGELEGKGNGIGNGKELGMDRPLAAGLSREEFGHRTALSTMRSKGIRDFDRYPLEDWEEPMTQYDVQNKKRAESIRMQGLARIGVSEMPQA